MVKHQLFTFPRYSAKIGNKTDTDSVNMCVFTSSAGAGEIIRWFIRKESLIFSTTESPQCSVLAFNLRTYDMLTYAVRSVIILYRLCNVLWP